MKWTCKIYGALWKVVCICIQSLWVNALWNQFSINQLGVSQQLFPPVSEIHNKVFSQTPITKNADNQVPCQNFTVLSQFIKQHPNKNHLKFVILQLLTFATVHKKHAVLSFIVASGHIWRGRHTEERYGSAWAEKSLRLGGGCVIFATMSTL